MVAVDLEFIDTSTERGPMAPERLVAVSYPVDGELTTVNTDVLGDTATVRFLAGLDGDAQLAALRQASALIGWQLRPRAAGRRPGERARAGLHPAAVGRAGQRGLRRHPGPASWWPATWARTRRRSPSMSWP